MHDHRRRKEGFWEGNGLTIALVTLFVLSLLGQSLTGLRAYSNTQVAHHMKPIRYPQYIRSGDFLEGIFENWQAAILQLASLIVFGVFLTQRGAAHSRKPDGRKRPHEGRVQSEKHDGWLYAHSLSIALLTLFAVFFGLHLLAGSSAYTAERALLGQPPISLAAFAVSSRFWFTTFQTWQAEYFAIAVYMVLTIFLRQKDSPESKPVDSSDRDTGETAG